MQKRLQCNARKRRVACLVSQLLVAAMLLLLTTIQGKAQGVLDRKITADYPASSLAQRLKALQLSTGITIAFDEKETSGQNTPAASFSNTPLKEVLQKTFAHAPFSWRLAGGSVVIITQPKPTPGTKKSAGKITGVIIDGENGLPVAGASVRIGQAGTTTAVDGSFSIALHKGSYTASVSYIGYGVKEVTGIEVNDNQVVTVNITLDRQNRQLAGVMVTASARKEGVAALYVRQKNNTAMTDGISAEQIARTPDKNIGESLKRVTGVSVLENKFVVVRGLGERYNSTLMNGQVMPSTELNRKQFSFDIIPANIVENITIYKTINPDKSAEFGGGLVEINTKSIPTENYFNITFGENYNDKTTGKNFQSLNIGTSNYFGSASKDRALLGKTDWKSGADIRTDYAAKGSDVTLFANNWKLYNYTPSVSPNLQASVGRIINLKNNNHLGFIASASYRNTWQTSDVIMGRNGYRGNDLQEELYGFTGKRYGFTTNLGVIVGTGYTARQFKVSLQSIYLRTYDQQLLLGTGNKDDYGVAVAYNDQTTQTSLLQNQLKGQNNFGKKGIKLDWMLSYAVINRLKPDNHQMDAHYIGSSSDGPDVTSSDFSIYAQRSNLDKGVLRSWSRSLEKNLGWNLDFTVPVTFSVLKTLLNNTVKMGYAGWCKDRLFWVLNTGSSFPSTDPQPLSQVFDATLRPGSTIEMSKFGDDYQRNAALHAGYVMLDSKIGSKLRLTGGVRGEYYDLNRVSTLLEAFVKNQAAQNQDLTDYSNLLTLEPGFNLFPSAAVSYAITTKMNLRFSFAKSIIRPDLRELAYFKEYDYELGGDYVSNTPIRSTKINNFDFRYEWYPNAGEIVSFSLFYKKLKYPMEVYTEGNRIFELRNDLSAKNKGIEVEARKSLAFTYLPVLRNITLYGNFTRLFAKVTPMSVIYRNSDSAHPTRLIVTDKPGPEVERPQAGASNYTYNAGLYYDEKPFSLSLSYNYITSRVFRAADVYKESLFETPLPSLDGQITMSLLKNKGLIKLNISNLLNKTSKVYAKRQGDNSTTLLYEKGDFIDYQSTPGRTYGLSFTYNF